jgi:RNA polymerase sigma factor (sigma-70 family)
MARQNGLIEVLRSVALRGEGPERTDADLLEAFVSRRDGAAFEALVGRHGPMVWGVCCRVLGNEADAEDAFQATFLVLVRKGACVVPRALVGNWLYGVAHNTALKARAMSRKRKAKELQAPGRAEPGPSLEEWCQARALLDEELARLPHKYRALIVLCDLGGKSRKEAARHFGVPEGTVAGRLARARALLANRLARRGVALSAGALILFLAEVAEAHGVPPPLACSLVLQAALCAASRTAPGGSVPPRVAALTEGVIQGMFLSKLKLVTTVLLATALLGGAAGALIAHAPRAEGERRAEKGPTAKEGEAPAKAPPRRAKDKPTPAEQKALDALKAVYALRDGEDLKCVKPPFPAARVEWFRAANARRIMVKGTDDPPSAMVWRWNRGEMKHWGATWGAGGLSLDGFLASLAGVYPQEVEWGRNLRATRIEADFVVREGAPAEKVVASLETILRKELRLPVKLTFKDVEQTVYVASGKYRYAPVKGRPAGCIELYAKKLSDPKFGGGGSGDLNQFFQWVGQFIGKRIVGGKIEGAPKGRISWHDNTPDGPFTQAEWEEAREPKAVLGHVTEQTGLTFKEEKRRVRVLFVERQE